MDSTSSQPRLQRQPISRPELICRKHGWQWGVILSANEECQIKEVRHNDELRDPFMFYIKNHLYYIDFTFTYLFHTR